MSVKLAPSHRTPTDAGLLAYRELDETYALAFPRTVKHWSLTKLRDKLVKIGAKAAWIVHGVGLALFHLPLGIPLTIIALPILFGLPYVVQRQRNLWTGFIVHGIFNMGGFLAVAFGIA